MRDAQCVIRTAVRSQANDCFLRYNGGNIPTEGSGGEVLASLAVRELCAGKGFLFADLGEKAMRGFEDPVRVFEVRWRE
jgi:hypothetical protein